MTRIVFISDTHEQHHVVPVPACDVLVHCGDATGVGRVDRLEAFSAWARRLKREGTAKEVIFVAGNHDVMLDSTHPVVARDEAGRRRHRLAREAIKGYVYLQDSEAVVAGLRFWGSPWTPRFLDWGFQLDSEAHEREIFSAVPHDIDVLITHGPPAGVLDLCPDGRRVGSATLLEVVKSRRPRVHAFGHAFGHIHHSYGVEEIDGIRFVNGSICTEEYLPLNEPVIVDL